MVILQHACSYSTARPTLCPPSRPPSRLPSRLPSRPPSRLPSRLQPLLCDGPAQLLRLEVEGRRRLERCQDVHRRRAAQHLVGQRPRGLAACSAAHNASREVHRAPRCAWVGRCVGRCSVRYMGHGAWARHGHGQGHGALRAAWWSSAPTRQASRLSFSPCLPCTSKPGSRANTSPASEAAAGARRGCSACAEGTRTEREQRGSREGAGRAQGGRREGAGRAHGPCMRCAWGVHGVWGEGPRVGA